VIFFARYHASQFGMMTIETEHLLLGLLQADKHLAERLLGVQGGAASIRAEIEQRVVRREKVSTSIDLPLTNKCKRILVWIVSGSPASRQLFAFILQTNGRILSIGR